MVRFGIIGAGVIAHKFCDAVTRVPGCSVTAVASRDQKRADAFAQEHQIPQSFGSYQAMLDAECCDVIYLATTNQTHADLAMQILDHRYHLLCEKPLTLTSSDAQRIIARAGEVDCFLMEALWSCFLPAMVTARRWIAEGLIGEVTFAHMAVGLKAPPDHRIRKPELGGGILYDLGVYPLHLIPFLLDKDIIDHRAIVTFDDNGIDVADALILHFDGALATIHLTMESVMNAPSLVYGTAGHIAIHTGHKAKKIERFDQDGELLEIFEDPYTNGFEHQIAHVLDCLHKGLKESPVVTHQRSLICTQIYDSTLV